MNNRTKHVWTSYHLYVTAEVVIRKEQTETWNAKKWFTDSLSRYSGTTLRTIYQVIFVNKQDPVLKHPYSCIKRSDSDIKNDEVTEEDQDRRIQQ